MNSNAYPIIFVQTINKIVKNMELVPKSSPINSPIHCFDSKSIPQISVVDYTIRIRKYSECSDSCFILAFIYIDRLLQYKPGFMLSYINIHRLILTTIILGIKYADDIYFDNCVYAKIGGVSLEELNGLERKLLQLLEYDLYVDPELYFQYSKEIDYRYKQIIKERNEGSFSLCIQMEADWKKESEIIKVACCAMSDE